MPISREAERRYPGGSLRSPEWLAIRQRILARARHRCEGRGCGVRNHEAHPVTGSRVVLTIARLDQDPGNNAGNNLRALCQKCHNAWDAPTRRLHAAETRRRALGNLHLFEDIA